MLKQNIYPSPLKICDKNNMAHCHIDSTYTNWISITVQYFEFLAHEFV